MQTTELNGLMKTLETANDWQLGNIPLWVQYIVTDSGALDYSKPTQTCATHEMLLPGAVDSFQAKIIVSDGYIVDLFEIDAITESVNHFIVDSEYDLLCGKQYRVVVRRSDSADISIDECDVAVRRMIKQPDLSSVVDEAVQLFGADVISVRASDADSIQIDCSLNNV